jgi:UDP-perosamine 4-acetyltransferase
MISPSSSIKVIGLGAGGHAKTVIEILRAMGSYDVIGLLEMNLALVGTKVLDVEVLGNDAKLAEIYRLGVTHAFNGVGTIGDTSRRKAIYEAARVKGFDFVSAIHPTATVSASARIGLGPTIMAGAIVNADVSVGDNVILNTGSIVEHDCIIGNHSHIATGALLAGGVSIGAGSHVGIGAVVRQGIKIGKNSIVGAGTVVINDVPDNVVVVGVPAQILRTVKDT